LFINCLASVTIDDEVRAAVMRTTAGPALICEYLHVNSSNMTSFLRDIEESGSECTSSESYEKLSNSLTLLCNLLFMDSAPLPHEQLSIFTRCIIADLLPCAQNVRRYKELCANPTESVVILDAQIATIILMLFRRCTPQTANTDLVSALSTSNLPFGTTPNTVINAASEFAISFVAHVLDAHGPHWDSVSQLWGLAVKALVDCHSKHMDFVTIKIKTVGLHDAIQSLLKKGPSSVISWLQPISEASSVLEALTRLT